MVFVRDALECLITENLSRGFYRTACADCLLTSRRLALSFKSRRNKKKKSTQTLETQNKKPTMGAADPPNKLFLYIYFFQLATHFSLGSRFYDLTGVTPPLSPIYSRPKMPAPLDKTVRRAARNDINLYRGANKAETTI